MIPVVHHAHESVEKFKQCGLKRIYLCQSNYPDSETCFFAFSIADLAYDVSPYRVAIFKVKPKTKTA